MIAPSMFSPMTDNPKLDTEMQIHTSPERRKNVAIIDHGPQEQA
jgi:hypothetical protein